MKIRTILIDDEPLSCMLLQSILSEIDDVEIIGTCHDGYEGLKLIQSLQPDLIFVDIQMPKITGVEMLELIEDKPHVIFATAYDAYAVKAFEMNAIDYLLKPFDKSRIIQAISKVRNSIHNNLRQENEFIATPESVERIVVKEQNVIKIISLSQIQYMEAAGDYIKLYTEKGFHIKHGKISYYEQLLQKVGFIRIHRSYLLNLQYLNSIESYNNNHVAILKNGQNIPISKSGFQVLSQNLL